MSRNLFKKSAAIVMTAACALSIVTSANIQTPVNPVLTADTAVEETVKGIEENKNSSFELVEDKAAGTAVKAQLEKSAEAVKAQQDKETADRSEAPAEDGARSELEVLETIDISATEKDNVTLTLYAAPSESTAEVSIRSLDGYSEAGEAAPYITAVVSGTGNMEDNVYRHFVSVDKYIATAKALLGAEYGLAAEDVYYELPEGIDETDFVEVDTNIKFFAGADCNAGLAGSRLAVNDNVRTAMNPADILEYSPDEISFEGEVTSISVAAFAFCNNLTEVKIPETVKTIGDNAFSFCVNLNSVVLNDGLEEIGERAFMHCRNLGELVLPGTVTAIGEDAFIDMKEGARIVCPNESVYNLAEGKGAAVEIAAEENKELQVLETYDISATQNDSVTLTLYSAPVMNTKTAFASGSTTVEYENTQSRSTEGSDYVVAKITGSGDMKANVYVDFVDVQQYIATLQREIGEYYGIGAENVEYRVAEGVDMNDLLQVDANIKFYAAVDCNAGPAGTVLRITNNIRSAVNPSEMLKYSPNEIVIENGVTSVSDGAFICCNDLTEVVLPESIKTIGVNAFAYCKNLTKVTLNEGLERIGERAFMYCTALSEIKLPTTIKTIDDGAFLNLKEASMILCPSYEIFQLVNNHNMVNSNVTTVVEYDAVQ